MNETSNEQNALYESIVKDNDANVYDYIDVNDQLDEKKFSSTKYLVEKFFCTL